MAYNINENSFKFVNDSSKIADQKLETKPISFVKDAFKQFCKNKSSVVAAIILGILILLAIFVPIFSPYNTGVVSASEQFLEPKIFEAGFGFWDGTKTYDKTYKTDGSISAIVYDFENQTPSGFYRPAVMNLVIDTEPTLVNQANVYGQKGYVMFENTNIAGNSVKLNSPVFTVTKDGNYTVNFDLLDKDGIDSKSLGEYRVLLSNNTDSIVLTDWCKNYGANQINLSDCLGGLDSFEGRLIFELKSGETSYAYILLRELTVSANQDVDNLDLLKSIGFQDATKMVLRKIDATDAYWSCTGRKGIYASEIYYCTFIYDTYAVAYDDKEMAIAKSVLQSYIDAGYCTYDEKVGPSSFVRLSDDCPIISVSSQKTNEITGKLQEITAVTSRYRYLGYKKMPKYIFGTDDTGVSLFTRMFKGLRTSLVLGFCTFVFCFLFGLVWGAISGYFGGTVDIVMERFCDILGGVPWIVIMTLCILHLGNNFLTFIIALCLTGWMGTAARTRTQFYRFKGREHVLASRTLGAKDFRLIFKHILPSALGTIVTSSVLMIPSVIFSEATLAYLNLGLQGVESFGVILSNNQSYIQSNSYLIIWPSVVIALLMISFNLFGNGLRDAINPTLKGSN